jgi:hypothetical protein
MLLPHGGKCSLKIWIGPCNSEPLRLQVQSPCRAGNNQRARKRDLADPNRLSSGESRNLLRLRLCEMTGGEECST